MKDYWVFLGWLLKLLVENEPKFVRNIYVRILVLATHLFSHTMFATVLWVDSFALSLTFTAHRLNLLHQSRAQLLHPYLHSRAPASRAPLHSSLLASPSYNIIKIQLLW